MNRRIEASIPLSNASHNEALDADTLTSSEAYARVIISIFFNVIDIRLTREVDKRDGPCKPLYRVEGDDKPPV